MGRYFDETMIRQHVFEDRKTHSPGSYTIELGPGDSSWNPTTTKGHRIEGPARVSYRLYDDGGWDAIVRDTEHCYE